jgi:hypothetical protein
MIAYHHCTATLPSEPFGLFFPLLTGDDYFDPSSARLPIFLPTTLSAVFARDLGSLFYPPMATSLSTDRVDFDVVLLARWTLC